MHFAQDSNSVKPSLCAKFKNKRCKKHNINKFISHKTYSVIHNSIAPSKEICSKVALGEVAVSLPW